MTTKFWTNFDQILSRFCFSQAKLISKKIFRSGNRHKIFPLAQLISKKSSFVLETVKIFAHVVDSQKRSSFSPVTINIFFCVIDLQKKKYGKIPVFRARNYRNFSLSKVLSKKSLLLPSVPKSSLGLHSFSFG